MERIARTPKRAGSRDALATFHPICDAVALLLRPHAEVVLHDLGSETVNYIANNFSKRDVGEPSLLHEIDFKSDDRTIGPYGKINFDGRALKSISAILRDPDDRAIAVLCINIDVSHIQSALQVLAGFATVPDGDAQPAALFKEDWHERINAYIHGWTAKRGLAIADMTRAQKQALVRKLADDGAFGGRHAAAYISKILRMGRATIYNYRRDSKPR